jgi:hypothetical protein
MSQQKELTACSTCLKNGVPKKYLDFEKLPTGDWLRLDHATQNKHSHRKLCDECRAPIYFKIIDGKTRPIDDSDNELHNCRSNPEKYARPTEPAFISPPAKESEPVITHSEGKLGSELVGLTIPPAEETNPIRQVVENKTGPQIEKIDLMLALLKNINVKTDDIAKMKKGMEDLVNAVNKYFDKTDNAIAEIAGAKFKTGTGKDIEMKSLDPQPTDEEISNMMEKDAEEDFPTTDEDDEYPESDK